MSGPEPAARTWLTRTGGYDSVQWILHGEWARMCRDTSGVSHPEAA